MTEILRGSLLWRALLAIAGFFGRMFRDSLVVRTLIRWWQSSGTRAFFVRHLSAEDRATASSGYTRLSQWCNDRLARIHRPLDWFRESVVGRIYGAVFRCGWYSRLLGWLFRWKFAILAVKKKSASHGTKATADRKRH